MARYEDSVAAHYGISRPRAQELRRCLEMIEPGCDEFYDHDDEYAINILEDRLINQCSMLGCDPDDIFGDKDAEAGDTKSATLALHELGLRW